MGLFVGHMRNCTAGAKHMVFLLNLSLFRKGLCKYLSQSEEEQLNLILMSIFFNYLFFSVQYCPKNFQIFLSFFSNLIFFLTILLSQSSISWGVLSIFYYSLRSSMFWFFCFFMNSWVVSSLRHCLIILEKLEGYQSVFWVFNISDYVMS